jgi:RHS repeat-associated protein
LSELTCEVLKAAGRLTGQVHSRVVLDRLADLVRGMNCYYSNLIEGHKTAPREIERALKRDFTGDEAQRDNQELSLAHIAVERIMEERLAAEPVDVYAPEFVCWLHREFYRLPGRRGKNTGYTYDAPTGLVKTITDRRSKVTTFNYDAHGNQTSVVDADGKTWVFTYDTAGRRATAKTPLNHTTTYTYDVADRVTRVTDPMGKFWDYTYDAMGNLLTEKTPLAGTTTTYTYDTRDRRLTSKDPLNYTTTYAYNGRNLLTSVTDPLSRVTTYDYDNAGRRTKITQPPAAVGGAPIITEFTYNLAGELTSVKDAKTQITQFHWEPTTRRATQTFPDASTELSDYDGAGNLTTFTNRSGQAMAKAYNENNWLITQNCPTCGAGFSYDDEGNLTQVVDATAGTYAWTYDDLNRVLVSTQPGGTTGGAKTVGYTYDNAGRPLTLTYPDGTVVTYSHDSRGLMNYVSSPVFGTSIGYDDAMRRSSQITPGGFHGSYTYDNASGLTGLTWGHQNTQITSHTWNHNSVSDITSTTATNGLSGSRTYTYDQVNRLKGRTVSGSLNTAHPATTWNLDAVGNRTSTVVGGTTTIYGLNAASLNQYATVGASSLTYDTRGNLLTDGTRTLTYDTDNRLTQAVSGANTIGYLYDFAHRLALRTEGAASVRYIYDQNWNVLADLNGATGATLRKYIHGPGVDEVLAQIGSTTATTYYLTKDHLGSATALIRASDNALVQRYTYDEYGAVTVRDSAGTPTGAAPLTRYLFTGREYDATVALYHYRHRWYHPGLGRFVQPDPIGFEGGDVNWYAYVLNKPLNFTDAFGLEGDNDGVLPEQEVPKKELLKGFCDAIKKFAKDAWNRGGHPAATGMSRGVGSLPTGAVSVAAEGENIYGCFKNLLDRKNELKKAGQMDPEDW